MIKVSTTGMVVPLKTDLRFPIPGQQGHGGRIIHLITTESPLIVENTVVKGSTARFRSIYSIRARPTNRGSGFGYLDEEEQ